MLSLTLRKSSPAHPGCKLKWDAVGVNELTLAAQELSSADFIVRQQPASVHSPFAHLLLR